MEIRPTLGPNVAAIICEMSFDYMFFDYMRTSAILGDIRKIFKIHGDIRRYWAILGDTGRY